jgi:hypothetical protein
MDTKCLRTIAMGLTVGMIWLAGCGDSNGDGDSDTPRGTFSVELSGSITEQLTAADEGDAFFISSAAEGTCMLQLSDASSARYYLIQLISLGANCPGPGTYTIAESRTSATAGQFWGTLLAQDAGMPPRAHTTTSGTVEITSHEDLSMTGTIDVNFVAVEDAASTLSAQGDFEAWTRAGVN